MEDLQEYDKGIENDLNYIEYELKRIKKKKGEDKKRGLRGLSNKVKSTQQYLMTYEMQLSMAPSSHKLQYEQSYQEKNTKLTELNLKIRNMQKEMEQDQFLTDVNAFPDKRRDEEMNRKDIAQMNQQELKNFGDKKLDKADKDLDGITKNLVQARDLNNDIQVELQRQKMKLTETREKAKDTQSLLKRSKKMISYFQKQLMTDKLIQCFMMIILIAIVVIIVMKFIKG